MAESTFETPDLHFDLNPELDLPNYQIDWDLIPQGLRNLHSPLFSVPGSAALDGLGHSDVMSSFDSGVYPASGNDIQTDIYDVFCPFPPFDDAPPNYNTTQTDSSSLSPPFPLDIAPLTQKVFGIDPFFPTTNDSQEIIHRIEQVNDMIGVDGIDRFHLQLPTAFPKEKPRVDQSHYWVRINTTTKGHSNRSGKINNFHPATVYNPIPAPYEEWSCFKYFETGELAHAAFTVAQVKEFLYNHPADTGLKLWIQKSPTDSARRYNTPESSKCKFKECPVRIHSRGSIYPGHYRIAFDEKWEKYGELSDPFITAGYVHLYCLERFLDFPEICSKLNIEVDVRALAKEPRHHFAASLSYAAEAQDAARFIEACQTDTLAQQFPDYPSNTDHQGERDKYTRTLCYAMNISREIRRPPAQIQKLVGRGLKGSHCGVHLGDLEMYCASKKNEPRQFKKKRNTTCNDVETNVHRTECASGCDADGRVDKRQKC